MTTRHAWRKSSFSGEEINCVELTGRLDAIRDSKNPAAYLKVGRASVEALVASVRAQRNIDR
jgi:hypothetical protein